MTPSQASHQPLSLQQPQLLVVEDDHSQRQLVTELLQAEGYRVCNADSVPAAILQLQQQPDIALVFSDWKLGSLSGLELLDYCKAHYPTAGFVIATAYGSVSHAVEAIQAGADDYLAKPFKRQELLLAVRNGLRARSLRKQNQQLSAALGEQQQLVDIIGHAPCMQQLFQRIQRNSGKSGRSRIIWCRKRCFYRRSRG